MRAGQWGTVHSDSGPAVAYVATNGTLWFTPRHGGWRGAGLAVAATFTVDWSRTRAFAHTDAWYEAKRRAVTPAEVDVARAGIARCHGWGTS